MAYPYTTGEYPGRQYKKRPPRKKREERDEGRPPFEEPGIGDLFPPTLAWTLIIEDAKDNWFMKPGRTAFDTKEFEREADGSIKLGLGGKPVPKYKRDAKGNVVLNARGEPIEEEQVEVTGEERAFKFRIDKPFDWAKGARKFVAGTAGWDAFSGQVEAQFVWDDYLMKQELGQLFYKKDGTLRGEAKDLRENTLTFAQRGKVPAPIRFRGPHDKVVYDDYFLENMREALKESGFKGDAALIQNFREECGTWHLARISRLEEKQGTTTDQALFDQYQLEINHIEDSLLRKHGATDFGELKEELKTRRKDRVGSNTKRYLTDDPNSLDSVRKRFKKRLANGELVINDKTQDFVKFFNLLEYRKLQFEIGFLLNSWDKGKTLPAKFYYLAKNYIYWNLWMKSTSFATGKFAGFYPPRLYSLFLHPEANLAKDLDKYWLDRQLSKFFKDKLGKGKYTWDAENFILNLKVLPTFGLNKTLAKGIFSENTLTGVEERLWEVGRRSLLNRWSLQNLSDFLVKGRGKAYGAAIKRLRKFGLPVAVLGGRGAWVQYALRKGIGVAVKRVISAVAGTVAPVVGAVVTEVGAWLGGKALKKAWKKPGEFAAYILGGCGCGCLTLAAPILVILAMMAIIPGMKKFQSGAGIPGYGGGGMPTSGIPPAVYEGDALPPGYTDITTWPVDDHTVTSSFGWRTLHWGSEFHRGIDIRAEFGSDVRSAGAGVVDSILEGDTIYGNGVIIDHGSYRTFYAHLSSIGVDVGQAVGSSAVLGFVGTTGRTDGGSHLHFGVFIEGGGGGWVDPCRWMDCQ